VTFSIDGINRTSVTLDASGKATLTVSDLSVGTHKITALYNGDANFNLNLSDDLTQSVIPPRSGDQNKVKIYAVVDSTSTSVQLFDASGALVRTVASPLGTSSVRAATADITGDGVPDIVFVAGPGGAPGGAIVDGSSNTVVRMFNTFESSFTGGSFTAAADFDGDGRPDIVVSADVNGGPVVKIFSGVDGSEMAAFFGIEDPNFRGGARVATGDINGDGTPDLLVAAGFGGGPRIAIYDGKSLRPGMKPVKLLPDFFVFEETLRNGVFISSGDLNNDGFAEVIVAGGPGGGPRVFALSGKELITAGNSVQVANFFAGDPNNRNGVRVTVKDLDGDNRADLVTGGEGSVSAFAGSGIPTDGTPTGMLNAPALQGLMGGIAVG